MGNMNASVFPPPVLVEMRTTESSPSFNDERKRNEEPLQILGFVNNLSDSTSLIDSAQREFVRELDFIKVSGHTTDFDKTLRSNAEKGFNKQELHVIFATSTLEVGVDFRLVNCLVIYGFPFSFNEYVQRIGRGGRTGNSFILTVCQPWKPIDNYFYSDAKRKISEQHKNLEPIPITRDNPDAILKHLRAGIFDILAGYDAAEKMFADLRLLDHEMSGIQVKVVEDAMKNLGLNEEQMAAANKPFSEFVKELSDLAQQSTKLSQKISLIGKFFEPATGFSDKYRLSDLRSTEPSVAVEISWDVMA